MHVWQCDDKRPIPRLVLAEKDPPAPAQDEALIRVRAAGVTPTELLWYPTTHSRSGQDRKHAVPSHEFSGILETVPQGSALQVGDEVYGMNDWFQDGATAELCCASLSAFTRKPRGLSHAAAASVPIAALTAFQGLFRRAQLQRGDRLLIHGGAGAVGVMAIQLARRKGARVITTASSRHSAFLRQLGADEIIDYRSQRFEDLVRDLDVVFDGVGGDVLARSWQVLNRDGRLVTIAASSEAQSDPKIASAFFIVEPDVSQLNEISALLENGEIIPVIDATIPFADAGRAYDGSYQPRSGRGKMVVEITP